jgi:hypothetical protein
MALRFVASKEIANLDTDESTEANVCRRFYDMARQELLRAHSWPWATVEATLGLVEEEPTEEWDFSYQVPSGSLKLIRILSGLRNDSRQSRVPYKVVKAASGSYIYTDQEDAILEYIFDEQDVDKFPPDFAIALARRIASLIAPSLTGGDPFKLSERNYQAYQMQLQEAVANSRNDIQIEEPPESEFIRGRE